MKHLHKMKKMLAVVTVFIFTLGLIVSAAPTATFAKTNETDIKVDVKKLVSDIDDQDVKDAVLRLNAFNIIHGMEDNKYHPEQNVTREQFAKILVAALNMDAAAKAAKGHTAFPDVELDRWSAGYISVATGQGLIKGYPDGTFKPAQEVSYAEAITMLVRALGYKDEFLPGRWPGNYLAKAAEKEITKKVKFADASGSTTRGDVAILVNNTLDAEVVKVDTYKGEIIEYKEEDITLLEDKLNIEKIEDARIIANKRIDDGLDWEEVTVRLKGDKKKDFDEKDYDLYEDYNVEPFLGEEITIYLNDDDEVVYVEREYDDKPYFDYVEEISFKDNGKVNELTLVKADDDFEFDEDAVVYLLDGDRYKSRDPEKLTEDDVNDIVGKVGKFVIKNRKIIYAEIMDSGETQPWFIVMDNDKGFLTGIVADDDEFDVDLRKDGDYDDVIVLDIDGELLNLEDIEEGNLLYIQKQEIDGDDYGVVRVVQNNTIDGKLTRVKNDRIQIDDKKEIKLTKYVHDGKNIEAYYSVDDGEEIKHYDWDGAETKDDMEDADDEYIIAYTDAVGRIAYFVTEAEAASGYKYGVVTRMYSDNDRIKIFTIDEDGEGDEIVYRVEEEDNLEENGAERLNQYGQKLKGNERAEAEKESAENPLYTTVHEGSVVKFKLNKAGEIKEDNIYVMKPEYLWRIEAGDDFGKDYLPRATRYGSFEYDDEAKGEGEKTGAYVKGSDEEETFTFSTDNNTIIIDAETYAFKAKTDSSDKKVQLAGKQVDYDSGEFAEAKWEDLKEANGIDAYFYVFADDDRKVNAKAVVFIGVGSGAASDDEEAIYVIDNWKKGEDEFVEYHAFDGKVEKRILDNDDDFMGKELPYIAKVKSNGDLKIIIPELADTTKKYTRGLETKDGFDIFYGQVQKRDASSLKVKNVGRYIDYAEKDKAYKVYDEYTFNISNKTLVYEEDVKKTTSNIRNGDYIIFVVEKGSNVRVVERLIDDEKDDMAELVAKLAGEKPEDDTPVATDFSINVEASSATATMDLAKENYVVSAVVYLDGNFGKEYAIDQTPKFDGEKKIIVEPAYGQPAVVTDLADPKYDGEKVTFTLVLEKAIRGSGYKLYIEDGAIIVTATKDNKAHEAVIKGGRIPITIKETDQEDD